MRPGYRIALRIVDADGLQCRDDAVAFDEFGNGALAHHLADMVDHLDHGTVDPILQHVLDEAAVDFQIVDGQVFQVGEGRHAGAEIVEREAAAQFA